MIRKLLMVAAAAAVPMGAIAAGAVGGGVAGAMPHRPPSPLSHAPWSGTVNFSLARDRRDLALGECLDQPYDRPRVRRPPFVSCSGGTVSTGAVRSSSSPRTPSAPRPPARPRVARRACSSVNSGTGLGEPDHGQVDPEGRQEAAHWPWFRSRHLHAQVQGHSAWPRSRMVPAPGCDHGGRVRDHRAR